MSKPVLEPDQLDLLAVMAHPDDAELLCGGSLAKAAAGGGRVGILDLTAGEMGSKGTPEIRALEAERARKALGVHRRECLWLPDASLTNDEVSRRRVTLYLRLLRPRVVVTHWKEGRHPDHRIACELVRDSVFLAGLKMYRTNPSGRPIGGGRTPAEPPAFRPLKICYATAFREDAEPPDFVVDISDYIDQRMEAMAAYASQFQGATGMGEVYPGGSRPIGEQVMAKLAHYGSFTRVAYGEPFRIDEAMEVHDLARLDIATH